MCSVYSFHSSSRAKLGSCTSSSHQYRTLGPIMKVVARCLDHQPYFIGPGMVESGSLDVGDLKTILLIHSMFRFFTRGRSSSFFNTRLVNRIYCTKVERKVEWRIFSTLNFIETVFTERVQKFQPVFEIEVKYTNFTDKYFRRFWLEQMLLTSLWNEFQAFSVWSIPPASSVFDHYVLSEACSGNQKCRRPPLFCMKWSAACQW